MHSGNLIPEWSAGPGTRSKGTAGGHRDSDGRQFWLRTIDLLQPIIGLEDWPHRQGHLIEVSTTIREAGPAPILGALNQFGA